MNRECKIYFKYYFLFFLYLQRLWMIDRGKTDHEIDSGERIC
jgi:hypothetical protein